MVRSRTATIKQQLDNLSREELDEVIAYAKGIRQWSQKSAERVISTTQAVGADPYDYVLAVVCNVYRRYGLSSDNSLAIDVAAAKNLTAYATFKKEIPEVVTYVRSYARERGQECAILRLAYSYLVADRVIQHMSGVLLMTAQIPTALNQMFPGYHPAGLMSIVVKRLGANGK